MWWWSILKSSRDEAYSKFLEEFGPGVDLESLELDNPEPDLIQLLGDEWHINLEAGKISFHSMTLGHEAFVQGMFEEEYPERYKEILGIIGGSEKRRLGAKPTLQGLFQIVSKYLDVSLSIMEFLRTRIIEADMDNRTRNSVVLPVSHPGYVRMTTETVIPKLDASGPTKSDIVFAITELMVDRMMREIHIFRNQEVERRVNSQMSAPLTNGFRDALTALYYEVLSTANSGGKKPHIVFNNAADNAARELIAYLEEVAGVYLEE